MSDTKHTPGPWLADTSRKYSSHARVDGNEKLICSVGNGESPDVAFGEWSANAHLIASAPELLECLKAMVVETVDYATLNKLGDPEQQHNVKWARSIIAKAEGDAA